jgi:hypothetical protein
MKFLLIVLVGLVAIGNPTRAQTLEQCKTTADGLQQIKSDTQFEQFTSSMTAGDELNFSTKLAHCIENHSYDLSAAQVDRLNRVIYRLDADVIARMHSFIERRHLIDAFNDEQEVKRKK